MTTLTKPVHRITNKRLHNKPVVITIAPSGRGDLIGLRLLRERTQYVISLQEVYQMAALRYANKESAARRSARKHGVPWRQARKQFVRENSIQ